jgi:hypothetical protein
MALQFLNFPAFFRFQLILHSGGWKRSLRVDAAHHFVAVGKSFGLPVLG